MFFASAQRDVQQGVDRYCRHIEDAMAALQGALARYVETQDREALRADVPTVHRNESAADDVRGDIEVLMFSRGVFPESRGEILQLLEKMDRVPNRAEAAVRMVVEQHIAIPEALGPQLLTLAKVSARAVAAMLDGARTLFEHYARATEDIGKIDEIESEVDALESELVERIFDSDMEGWQKILLRDLVARIASLSDSAEAVGEHIRIMVAKRTL